MGKPDSPVLIDVFREVVNKTVISRRHSFKLRKSTEELVFPIPGFQRETLSPRGSYADL